MGKKKRSRRSVTARIKVWLEIDGHYVFGRGICDILQAVHDTGSIKAAAGRVDKSYRHVWSRIKEAERAIGAPLVASQVGGKIGRRTELTPLGSRLVKDFVALRATVAEQARVEFTRRFSDLR